MGTVCKHCPFKDSPDAYVYDEDAMEALDAGEEPACHARVGADSIFAHAPMTPAHPCQGHLNWENGLSGYKKPNALDMERTP